MITHLIVLLLLGPFWQMAQPQAENTEQWIKLPIELPAAPIRGIDSRKVELLLPQQDPVDGHYSCIFGQLVVTNGIMRCETDVYGGSSSQPVAEGAINSIPPCIRMDVMGALETPLINCPDVPAVQKFYEHVCTHHQRFCAVIPEAENPECPCDKWEDVPYWTCDPPTLILQHTEENPPRYICHQPEERP